MAQKNELFSDTIRINDIDKDGKFFEKVSRIEATGEETYCKISLDINCDIYQVSKENIYNILITKSLDGNPSDNKFTFDVYTKKSSLVDSFDYIMHGKVFKYTEEGNNITTYASFGGLILGITGPPKVLKELKVDERIYLLLKKISNY